MKPSEILERHREEVRRIVAAHGHSNARVFGSVARGEDDHISDLDFLIDFGPQTTLFDISRLYIALSDLLGIEIDIVGEDQLSPRMHDRVIAEAVAV